MSPRSGMSFKTTPILMNDKMNMKIASWNLCLGLPNKKDIVIDYLKANNVKICCLQETEIDVNFPEAELSCKNFNLELEENSSKRRVGIYLNTTINYVRRKDLELPDHHIVVIDIITDKKFRIINLYRSFRPQGGLSPDELFKSQLGVLKNALSPNCLILGDFNLDAGMEFRLDYPRKATFNYLTDFVNQNNLSQLVNFPTWSRTINGIKKESLLDHVYANDTSFVSCVYFKVPTFGDHVLVIVELNAVLIAAEKSSCKRNWTGYSKEILISSLNLDTVQYYNNVQVQWNSLENSLINAADFVAPLMYPPPSKQRKNHPLSTPVLIKNKMNKRKRLLQLDKARNCVHHRAEIKVLNSEINEFFAKKRVDKVRSHAKGQKQNLWKAVKVARGLNPDEIPSDLTLGGVPVATNDVAGSFARHFADKIKIML